MFGTDIWIYIYIYNYIYVCICITASIKTPGRVTPRLALSITWDAEGLPCSHPILAVSLW